MEAYLCIAMLKLRKTIPDNVLNEILTLIRTDIHNVSEWQQLVRLHNEYLQKKPEREDCQKCYAHAKEAWQMYLYQNKMM